MWGNELYELKEVLQSQWQNINILWQFGNFYCFPNSVQENGGSACESFLNFEINYQNKTWKLPVHNIEFIIKKLEFSDSIIQWKRNRGVHLN